MLAGGHVTVPFGVTTVAGGPLSGFHLLRSNSPRESLFATVLYVLAMGSHVERDTRVRTRVFTRHDGVLGESFMFWESVIVG